MLSFDRLREEMDRITSRRSPTVARFRAAAAGDPDRLLLDGAHLVGEALAAGIRLEDIVVASDKRDAPDIAPLLARSIEAGAHVAEASAAVMAAVSPVRSASAIVATSPRSAVDPERMYAAAAPLLVIAIDVQDPGNVGAIVRVAEAGGASGVMAVGATADPFGWKAIRGSMGSVLRIPVAAIADTGRALDAARRHGCRIVAAVPRSGVPPEDLDWTQPTAIVVGGEGPGLSAGVVRRADAAVTIPMAPAVESLNTAVAAALLVYEARRQRERAAGKPRLAASRRR